MVGDRRGASGASDDAERFVPTRELLNDEFRHRLEVQRSAGERLEAKAIAVLVFSGTALQLVSSRHLVSDFGGWLLIAYLVTMALCVGVLLPRRYAELNIDTMAGKLWRAPRRFALSVIADQRREAFDKNRRRHSVRTWLLWSAFVVLLAAMALSALHLANGTEIPTPKGTNP